MYKCRIKSTLRAGRLAAPRIVRQVVDHHLGAGESHVHFLPGGRTNFVFEVKHKRERYVVRINSDPAKLQNFLKEQWAISKVKKLRVPTPQILEVGNEISEWPYMISRLAAGTEATFHPRRNDIITAMGRYAAIINSVHTKGFGETFDWSKNQLSRNLTWENFLDDEYNLSHRLNILKSHRLISERQARRVRSVLRSSSLPGGNARLNHGDLRLKNVLVNPKGTITAIVDWEHCVSSSIAWELSISLHDLSIDEKQQFLSGYDISHKALTRTAPLIKALNILNYVPIIENLTSHQRLKQLRKYEIRLKGTLDLFCL